jgi:hypothetical protein
VLSHDGKVVAYQARRNGKSFIRVGHHEEPAFDKVSAGMAFSPDGKLVAYGAQQFGKNFLVSSALYTPISQPADLFDNAIVRDGGIEHWYGILRGRGGKSMKTGRLARYGIVSW